MSSERYKIVFTMVNGQQFTLSRDVHLGLGTPLKNIALATVQLSGIMETLQFFSANDGTLVMTRHIMTARIEAVPYESPPATDAYTGQVDIEKETSDYDNPFETEVLGETEDTADFGDAEFVPPELLGLTQKRTL